MPNSYKTLSRRPYIYTPSLIYAHIFLLIGCYLLKCGQATAAKFMQWIGVYGDVSDGGDISKWFVKPASAILPHVDKVGLQDRVQRIENKINHEDVEKILGYQFRWGKF